MQVSVKVRNKEILQISVSQSSRTLEVYVTPALSWKSHFEIMRKKVNEAVVKLSIVEMNYHQTVIYYNVYMLTSIYFRSRIIELDEKEEIELMRITEPALLRKMGLSVKFPRTVMYESQNILGMGFIKPSTMIAVQMIKMHVGNVRLETKMSVLIKSLNEYNIVESGIENR